MFADILQWFGYGLCHQLPERSFFGGGLQVPVCARDTGIYVGFAVALLVIAALSRGTRPSELPRVWLMVVGVVMLGTMAFDGVTSYAGLRETTNDIRLLTGLAAGYSLTLALAPILNGQLWRVPGRGRVLSEPRSPAIWLASLPVAFVVVRWGLPLLGGAYSVVVVLSILFTFSSVNLAIVALAPPFENRFDRLGQAWLPVLLAVLLTLAELWATGALRGTLERAVGIA